MADQNPAQSERRSAVVECRTCGMPVRVIFEADEIVQVFAPCGHVTSPEAGEAHA